MFVCLFTESEMDLIDVGWALFFEENVEDENEYLALTL